MAEFEMRSPLELLKTLEGYIVNSVEIKYTGPRADVEISASEHGNFISKTVSFSIEEAS